MNTLRIIVRVIGSALLGLTAAAVIPTLVYFAMLMARDEVDLIIVVGVAFYVGLPLTVLVFAAVFGYSCIALMDRLELDS